MDLTNEQMEAWQFKHFKLDTPFKHALAFKRSEMNRHRDRIDTFWAIPWARDEPTADSLGVTTCDNNDVCPTHKVITVKWKTSMGWIPYCCCKDLGLAKLENTYVPPTLEEFTQRHEERIAELNMIITYRQRKANERSLKARANKRAIRKSI